MKKVTNRRISLFKWIWRSYLQTVLIPLILVVLVTVAIYFFTFNWSQSVIVQFLKQKSQNVLVQIADREANTLQQQLLSISHATDLFRRQIHIALSTPASLSAEDATRLADSPQGPYFTGRDREDGGAAVFFSGFVPIGKKEREKVARLLTTQALMKNIKKSQPLAAAVYFNTFDSLNIIYPYFDVLAQYPPLMDIPSYNFYYEADQEHNPERKVQWTDAYLDPAGNGWMASAIAPVYDDDFLEGVVGIDVTVDTIINQVIKMELPGEGYAILVGKDGNLLALPKAGEKEWGLTELTDHQYREAIKKDTFKPEQFNLKKRKSLGSFRQAVFEKRNGYASIQMNGNPQVAAWSTIDETGWKLIVLVREKNIFAEVNRVGQKLLLIGTIVATGLVLFCVIFFYLLAVRARKLSREIAKPLVDINGIAQRIGAGMYSQPVPDLPVDELFYTASYLVDMGNQLGATNNDLLATQNKLKAKEADLNALVNSIEDIIIQMDGDGNFLNLWIKEENNPFQSPSGEPHQSLDALLDWDMAESYKEIIRRVIATGKSESFEFLLGGKTETRYFLARVSLVDKTAGTVVVCAREISDRVAMEKSLIIAKEEAEKASNAKSQFLSSMSHELRTPLNAVLGFAQLLESDEKTPLKASQRKMVMEIEKAGDHLLELINEILDLSMIESNELKVFLEPVPVEEIINETTALINPMAERRNIKIIFRHTDCMNNYIFADMVRIKQVLLNILANAIKYNKENGEVTIRCQKKENRIHICIGDTGYGIPETELDAIFQPFHRIKNTNVIIDGAGVGLAVAKQLVELMQGRISVDSKVGIGSLFCVEMPTAETPMATLEIEEDSYKEPLSNDNNNNIRKILYIEDNEANLRLVKNVVKKIPDTVLLSAASGELCVDLAMAHEPDLILLDINLPGMDGYEVLAALREHQKMRNIPVIAVSAGALPSDIKKGFEAGFDDYITKPFFINDFIKKLKIYLPESSPDIPS